MNAIIETGGKQYRIKEKDVLMVEKLEAEEGTVITFDKVLAILKDGDIQTGSSLENAKVTAKVLTHGKGKKIMVFKYKAKSNYRRRQGHRQPFTRIMIESIEG
ncbi:MAG: 50S ribosomal protein L21 [Negativicutes bacterium]|nr:50S ribosomal protein L21 [Negativicutes bacterium]